MTDTKLTKGLKTKLNIIDAAKQIFYEKGFAKATLKEICQQADVKSGNFSYYFKSKEALVHEIYSELYMKSYSFVEAHIHHKIDSIEKNVHVAYVYYSGLFWDEKTIAFHYEITTKESATEYLGYNFKRVYQQFLRDLKQNVDPEELDNLMLADTGLRREINMNFMENPKKEKNIYDLVKVIHIYRGRLLQMDENIMKAYLFNASEFERKYDHSHIHLLI